MNRELSFSSRPEHAGMCLLAILCLPFLSCIQSESITCSSGLLCASDTKCSASGDACIRNDCGDSVLQDGEVCDDGNISNGDGCNADCTSDERCGNKIIDTGKNENCDDGNIVSGDGCSADCKAVEECGNGVKDAAEMCDDGNVSGNDGCSADCKSDESCGNGIKDATEICDDGNNVEGDGCSADCASDESCGNGVLDASEVCDDGDNDNADGCNADCTSDESCGNGIEDVTEACDDDNNVGGDGCSADCRSEEGCRNGIRDPGEECDDGNSSNEDNCLSSCVLARCGDGFIDQAGPVVEECDDGNALACGTCGEACRLSQESSAASGSIDAIRREQLADGEIFSIGDGRTRLFFEFEKTGGTHGSHVPVLILNADTVERVATAMEVAIRSFSSTDASAGRLRIRVSRSDDKETVLLEHANPGTHGNQDIIESVKNGGFNVRGMRGGAGHDCPVGTSCTDHQDCTGDGRGIGQCVKQGDQRIGKCVVSD